MSRAVRVLAYAGAFIVSAVVSALSLSRLVPLLPPTAPGLLFAVIIVVAAAWGIAVVERRLTWSHWLEPRGGEPVPILDKARSSLLSGKAPPPLAVGAIAGLVWYVKTG